MTRLQQNSNNGSYWLIIPKSIVEAEGRKMGDEFLVSDEPNRAKFIKEIQASHKPASKQSSPPIPVITAEEFYENVVG
jgi:hypothetical protein